MIDRQPVGRIPCKNPLCGHPLPTYDADLHRLGLEPMLCPKCPTVTIWQPCLGRHVALVIQRFPKVPWVR